MTRAVPTYALYGENSGGDPDFWLHCETISSRSSRHRWEIRLHRHAVFFQILYIAAGSGEATFGTARHAIVPPAVITVPAGVSHGFRFSRDIDGLVITIVKHRLGHLRGDGSHLGDWLAQAHLVTLDPQAGDDAYVMQTLVRLGEEFETLRAGRNDLMAGYMELAVRLTARRCRRAQSGGSALSENARRMERFAELLGEHGRAHKPATFYAEQLGISATHLNRIVRAETGGSTHDMIAARMIEAAKRDLVFTANSVREIGHRLGFSDPAYFSRFFRRRTGQSPRSWRLKERARLAPGAA